jgi:cytochrome bd-type quinol oxidase subunit 2
MIAEIVYLLCAATALLCAVLLLRGYSRSKARLLFWSGLCFVLLVFDNLFLFYDVVIVPDVNLTMWRAPTALIGVGVLLYGLIWEKA